MSNMALFQPATRHQRKLRMALVGPSGSGKTFTALTLATALGGRIAVIDTERGSASAYADRFEFDTLQLTSFAPDKYLEGVRAAGEAGYGVLIIDSLSHAWAGKDGILEFVDKVAARSGRGNSFGAWREATPVHNSLVDGILDAQCHVIVTMRSKQEYVQEKDERTGKTNIRKVGMQPVQRDGLEYEMDIVADLDWENTLIVSKTRCEALQGYVQRQPGEDFAGIVREWLGAGAPAPARSAAPAAESVPHLSADKAESLAGKLAAAGVKDVLAFAGKVVGRSVGALTDLTTGEALRVFDAAPKPRQKAAPHPFDAGPPVDIDAIAETVEVEEQPRLDVDAVTAAQLKMLHTIGTKLGFTNGHRDDFRAFVGDLVGRKLESSKDLSKAEATQLLDHSQDEWAAMLDSWNAERQMAAEGAA